MAGEAIADAPATLAPLADVSPHVPLRLAVLDRVRAAILDGAYAPGTALSENRIAGELEVSRTPVREALRALEQEGLLEWQPGRRLAVPVPTAREVDEVYDVRALLESEAIRRIRPDDAALIAKLRACVERGRKAARAGRAEALAQPETDFHAVLISALDNRRLEQFVDSMQDLARRFRRYTLDDADWAQEVGEHHALVLALIEGGRTEEAVAVLREHLARAAAVLRRRLGEA